MVLNENNFYIQNDFYDAVVNNPEEYNNEENFYQLFLAGNAHIKGYKVFNYLLLDSVQNDYFDVFLENMFNFDLYDKYIEDVNNRSDDFIKAFASIFLEPSIFNTYFKEDVDIVNKVLTKEGNYNNSLRVYGLVGLSDYAHNEKEIINIKKSIKKIMENDKEYIENVSLEQRQADYIDYTNAIDERQKELKRGLILDIFE